MANWNRSAAFVALLGMSVASVASAQEEGEDRIIELAPAAPGVARPPRAMAFSHSMSHTVSEYMIGISATPVTDELRAQVDLPAGAGLVVGELIDDAPASEAGIERYDILVSADGKKLKSMEQLIDAVDKHGKDESKVTIELLRKGEGKTVEVAPIKRPQVAAAEGGVAGMGMPGAPQVFQFRNVGPMMLGMPGGEAGAPLPDGVAIQILKSNDSPTKIIVKRGDEEWTVEGDDEEALAELPDDLRPAIEGLLHDAPGAGFAVPGMPGAPGQPGNMMFRFAVPGGAPGAMSAPVAPGTAELERRLQELEQQLQDMRQALEDRE